MYNNINLIQNQIEMRQQPKRKRGWFYKFGRFLFILLIAYFVVAFFLSSKIIFSQESFGKALSKLPVINQIRSILGVSDTLIEQDDDRINFLLMGIGGMGHEGALLTDTMILASVQLSTKQISLVSIPRDLLVKIPGNGFQRINHASAYGDVNNYTGGGGALAAETVSTTFDLPIDYWLRVDFAGFKTVIDELGGIDVTVDNSFTDSSFPTNDFGIKEVSFTAGLEHMDGERALTFARSRHGNNGEGSDFARSKRQQKIIMAVKQKIFSWKTLANPNRIYNIFTDIKAHTQTNVSVGQITEIIDLFKDVDFDNIEHYVIDNSPGGLLKSTITDDGAQVLIPKAGDLSELQEFVANLFFLREIAENNTKVIIANGTEIDGLATYLGTSLSTWGFTIERLVNSPVRDFEKTVIYNIGNGNEEELKIIKNRISANVGDKVPEYLQELIKKTDENGASSLVAADFLVVAGLDQEKAIAAIKEWQAIQAANTEFLTGDEGEKNMKKEEGGL